MTAAWVNQTTPQSGGANTLVLNMPASIVAGNLLLAFLRNSAQSTAITPPAGWTAATGLNTSNNTTICYRWADGTESATYTFTAPAAQTWSEGICVQISGGVGSGQPFDVATTGRVTSVDVNAASLSTTTTVADTLLLYSDMKNNASRTLSSAPSGMTNRSASASLIHIFTASQAAAGATGAKQAVFTATSLHYNALVAIKSAPASSAAFLGIL